MLLELKTKYNITATKKNLEKRIYPDRLELKIKINRYKHQTLFFYTHDDVKQDFSFHPVVWREINLINHICKVIL